MILVAAALASLAHIGKDEDKGAERLWGILSAWFAGGGAPPPQCAQGAIWKTHGSSG